MSLPDVSFLRSDKFGAVVIDVHVVPNASRTQTDGLHDGALRVRLNAPPVDGKANLALIKWIAAELKITCANIELIRGETNRRKQLRVSPEQAGSARWAALLPQAATGPEPAGFKSGD